MDNGDSGQMSPSALVTFDYLGSALCLLVLEHEASLSLQLDW